jgi:hypothetical protein
MKETSLPLGSPLLLLELYEFFLIYFLLYGVLCITNTKYLEEGLEQYFITYILMMHAFSRKSCVVFFFILPPAQVFGATRPVRRSDVSELFFPSTSCSSY